MMFCRFIKYTSFLNREPAIETTSLQLVGSLYFELVSIVAVSSHHQADVEPSRACDTSTRRFPIMPCWRIAEFVFFSASRHLDSACSIYHLYILLHRAFYWRFREGIAPAPPRRFTLGL